MDSTELIDRLDADGALLATAAAGAGWDAPVPNTTWMVRELVTHVGGVHRWATSIVAGAQLTPDAEAGRAVGTGPADEELLDWFRAGHAAIVETLRAAPEDLVAFNFLPAASPREFWCRRQAHETAVHRADAEGAAGGRSTYPPTFAQDGIGEMLLGFGARRGQAIATPATLGLRPTDGGPPWQVTFGGEHNVAEQVAGPADAVVTGSSADLYLWLWNRPAIVEITGDPAVAELWSAVQVRWG